MILNVLIVDFLADEANALKEHLGACGELEARPEICNLEGCIEFLQHQQPELILLNIDAVGNQAGAVLQKLRETAAGLRVVFVAENAGFSAAAFELNVYDYLLKPVSRERLLKTMARLTRELKADPLGVLPVWKNDRFVVLKPEQIVYCYTIGNKTLIKSNTGEYTCLNTLYSFEQKLSSPAFFRTHKSFLVNLEYIKEIIPWFNHTYHLVLNHYENDEIPVSRTHLKDFKKRMGID